MVERRGLASTLVTSMPISLRRRIRSFARIFRSDHRDSEREISIFIAALRCFVAEVLGLGVALFVVEGLKSGFYVGPCDRIGRSFAGVEFADWNILDSYKCVTEVAKVLACFVDLLSEVEDFGGNVRRVRAGKCVDVSVSDAGREVEVGHGWDSVGRAGL
jgi:hypothetical protein